MRWRLAQIVALVAAWLLSMIGVVAAQENAAYQPSNIQPDSTCPSSSPNKEKPPGPQISIVEVGFSGSLQMPVSDQAQIKNSIKQKTQGISLGDVTDEALERARTGWQDRGYFKVHVSGDVKTLTSSPTSQRISLKVHVDEGMCYKLRGISFKNNKAVTNIKVLRSQFPIKDGDVFSRQKIATGIENLRKAYGAMGYINFTSVPIVKFDDENELISVDIDFDEGNQFFVSSVEVLGLDETARESLLKYSVLERGQVYNSQLWEFFLLKVASKFPNRNYDTRQRLDEKLATVALTLDFRPCVLE